MKRKLILVTEPLCGYFTHQIVSVYAYFTLSSRVCLLIFKLLQFPASPCKCYCGTSMKQHHNILGGKKEEKTDLTTHKHAQSARISLSFKTNCSLFCFTLLTKFVVSGSARSKSASAERLIFTRFKEHSNP